MENDKKGNFKSDSVFSKKVRAGKRRTYFFDVKATKTNDYFLTITESKKRMDDTYERFKVFVYKEDLNKFLESLTETIDHIRKELMPDFDFDVFSHKDDYNENYNPHNSVAPTTDEVRKEIPITDHVESSIPEAPKAEEIKVEGNPGANVNDDDLKW